MAFSFALRESRYRERGSEDTAARPVSTSSSGVFPVQRLCEGVVQHLPQPVEDAGVHRALGAFQVPRCWMPVCAESALLLSWSEELRHHLQTFRGGRGKNI